MKKIISGSLIFALLTGCSTVPYQPTEKVEPTQDFWRGPSFKQKDEFIDSSQMIREFRKDPRKAELLDGYEPLSIGGLVLAAGGGFCLGYGIGKAISDQPGQSEGAGVLIGVGLVTGVVGVVLGASADRKLHRAIDLHNSEVPSTEPPARRKSGELQLSPGGIAWVF